LILLSKTLVYTFQNLLFLYWSSYYLHAYHFADESEARWQKTPAANLMRHRKSGNYARIRLRSKLIWKSLKTVRISVAKLRLGDFHKTERQRAGATKAVARGK
jgi:hypothetical protein